MIIGPVVFVTVLLATQSPASASDALTVQAVVEASPETVWDAFTTKQGIESWMVATGDVDLAVGGLMRTAYRKGADLAGETAIHQVILSFDPGRMLSFRTVKTPRGFPFPGAIARSWTVIYLEPADAGRTRVTITMLGYGSDPESQKMRAFFEVGNQATLTALVERFGSGSSRP